MPLIKKNLRWRNLKSITTDGGKNMCGKNKGVVALVSKAVENDGGSKPLVLHCIIHQQSLCGKCLDMSEVLKPLSKDENADFIILNNKLSTVKEIIEELSQLKHSHFKLPYDTDLKDALNIYTPSRNSRTGDLVIPQGIVLVDEGFTSHLKSRAEHVFDIFGTKQIQVSNSTFRLIYSKFGYVVTGSYIDEQCYFKHCFLSIGWNTLDKTLRSFWETQNISEEQPIISGDCLTAKNTLKKHILENLVADILFSFDQSYLYEENVLSQIACIFDLLGLLGPVISKAKFFMQQLWLLKLEWHEKLPVPVAAEWASFVQSLPVLEKLKIPRFVLSENLESTILYGFSVASEKGFGAVTYVSVIKNNSDRQSQLLCNKSRVAPLKTLTIPSWIKTPPHLLKTFVANRVSKIQELTVNFSWHHISSENNPADFVSRGLNVSDLITSPLWWKGPDPSIFTNNELLENINDCEVKKEFKIPPSKNLLLSS
ncbi:uncharacterized protein TNIN_9991 [Trichonephila inaurata madagascariensis]|uniref:Uncharacterized protein n=1 Tax=Trichonephila inaurata madagascariensis TaxID=2747483 RepID=A0A8X6YRX1_9ARAC|nr:uncharacterized protein TNIN_9991 [Trichonephila inaurata madagascariensis]